MAAIQETLSAIFGFRFLTYVKFCETLKGKDKVVKMIMFYKKIDHTLYLEILKYRSYNYEIKSKYLRSRFPIQARKSFVLVRDWSTPLEFQIALLFF